LLRALIFDVDGTLAETEELHRRAFNDTFAAQGLGWHWTPEDYGRLLRTTGGKERIACFVAERGGDPARIDIAALHGAKTARYAALMAAGGLRLRPGIAGLMAEGRRGCSWPWPPPPAPRMSRPCAAPVSAGRRPSCST